MRVFLTLSLLVSAVAFFTPGMVPKGAPVVKRAGPVYNGEVEITFGSKKTKGKPGESLKALAAKVKAPINYGCEEGKCGSCEHKGSDGKKYRICIGKVPKIAGPLVLKP